MKTPVVFLLSILFGLFLSSLLTADKSRYTPNDRTLITVSPEAAGMEFQKLRKIKGHFSGGKWLDSVDSWMGRKHRLMLYLQKELTSRKARKDTITEIMGTPDYTLQGDNPQASEFFLGILSDELKGSDNEILIYKWRGSHDFMYLVLREDRLIKSDWWMAME